MASFASKSFLTSPTASAVFARSFSNARICSSSVSIFSRSGSSLSFNESAMATLEVLQEGDQSLNPFERHGVINRSTHSANRFVPFELQQASSFRLRKKLGVQ